MKNERYYVKYTGKCWDDYHNGKKVKCVQIQVLDKRRHTVVTETKRLPADGNSDAYAFAKFCTSVLNDEKITEYDKDFCLAYRGL